MYCTKCGLKNSDENKFCQGCGNKLIDVVDNSMKDATNNALSNNDSNINSINNSNKDSNKKSNKIIPIAIAVVAATIILGALTGVLIGINVTKKQDAERARIEREKEELREKKAKKNEKKVATEEAQPAMETEAPAPEAPAPVAEAVPADQQVMDASSRAGEEYSTDEILLALDAYQNFYENNRSEYPKMSLFYMNDDKMPEMALMSDVEAAGNMICTWHNNDINTMYTSRCYFAYLDKENLLLNSDGNMGYYYDNIYSITNHQFILVDEGETSEMINDAGDDFDYSYVWNGQLVSEDEYSYYLNTTFPIKNATTVYDMQTYEDTETAYQNLCLKYK